MNPASVGCLAAQHSSGGGAAWGPGGMVRWLRPQQSQWCFSGKAGSFDAQFLVDWGARYAPRMHGRYAWEEGQRRGCEGQIILLGPQRTALQY